MNRIMNPHTEDTGKRSHRFIYRKLEQRYQEMQAIHGSTDHHICSIRTDNEDSCEKQTDCNMNRTDTLPLAADLVMAELG